MVLLMILIHSKTLNQSNVLALLGVVSDVKSVTLITNLVSGNDLHSILFGTEFKTKVGAINKFIYTGLFYLSL